MGKHPHAFYLDQRDEAFMKKMSSFFEGLYRHYFRVQIKDWEKIPAEGPNEPKLLFVSNHNGILTFEMLMLFYHWYKLYGFRRKALGLAHSLAVKNPIFSWLCSKIGAIEASPENAKRAFDHGYHLLVYPGGLKEAFRPFRDRKKVDFYQRKGFIRLAVDSGAQIVPVVSVGAAETYVIFDRGEALAKRLGVYDKLRLAGVPMTARSIFFYFCVVSGLFTFFPLLIAPFALIAAAIPLPAQMTFRILDPIDPKDKTADQVYEEVTSRMQRAMTEEYELRKFPVLG